MTLYEVVSVAIQIAMLAVSVMSYSKKTNRAPRGKVCAVNVKHL